MKATGVVSDALEANTSTSDRTTVPTFNSKSRTDVPSSPTTTERVIGEYPMKVAVTSYVPAGISLIENAPLSSAVAPKSVPTITTLAPSSGFESVSHTVPTTLCENNVVIIIRDTIRLRIFIIILLVCYCD